MINACFFDPQYHVTLGYSQDCPIVFKPMESELIVWFIREIDRVLIPSGHLFLWVKKSHLCRGVSQWLDRTSFEIVDMVTWDKQRSGRGYRTVRTSEYLMVLQKGPKRAKGIWKIHNIPDIWQEKVDLTLSSHAKRSVCRKN